MKKNRWKSRPLIPNLFFFASSCLRAFALNLLPLQAKA